MVCVPLAGVGTATGAAMAKVAIDRTAAMTVVNFILILWITV